VWQNFRSALKKQRHDVNLCRADMPEGKEGNSSAPIRESSRRLSVPHTSEGYSATAVHFGKRHGEKIREQSVKSERRLPGKERSPVEANFSNHYLQASSQREEGKFIYDDRNITSRTSRDRRDDQEMRQPSELTSKRAKDREKERRISVILGRVVVGRT
jgi:hypothetical protein